MKHKISFLFIIILSCISVANKNLIAQTYNFKIYSVDDGLSQSQVFSLCQDSRDNIWVGTWGGGVNVFNGKSFIKIDEKDGLSNSQIWEILEDKNGNIWVGTDNGLNIFTGNKILVLNSQNGLAGNSIISIEEDYTGKIWVSVYEKGLNVLTFKNVEDLLVDSLRNIQFITTKGGCLDMNNNCAEWLNSNIIRDIQADPRGNMWFATDDKGIAKYDGKSFYEYGKNEGLNFLRTRSLILDNHGNIWFGTIGGGVYKFNNVEFTQYSVEYGLSNTRVVSMFEDKKGNIWAGTHGGGVNKFSFINKGKTDEQVVIKSYNEMEGLSNGIIWSIEEDTEGNMWFGTNGGGINKFSGEIFVNYSVKDGLSKNEVISIIEDKNYNLWFGTIGGGVNFFDGKIFIKYNTSDGLKDNQVWSLLEDHAGKLWFGTYSGINQLTPDYVYNRNKIEFFNEGLTSQRIMSMFQDKDKNIWFGTSRGGISKYNGNVMTHYSEGKLIDTEVKSIIQDKLGNIWFSTSGIGVIKYDGNTFKYIDNNDGLSDNRVYSTCEDSLGNIWFGTYGKGISILINPLDKNILNSQAKIENRKLYEWVYINADDGLSDDAVVSMLFGDNHTLWTGTNNGISKIVFKHEESKIKIKKITNYSKKDGFTGIECNQNAICRDHEGNIWFGTINGAVKYNPSQDKENKLEPQTHITNLKLFYENVDWSAYTDSVDKWYHLPRNLKLSHTQYHLTFEFIGISLRTSEKVKYQYILDGFDEDWSPPVKENVVTYSKIPPGNYTFKVKACNNDGVWNEIPATFNFSITPPFWMTWWFYILCAFVVSFTVNKIYNLRIGAKIRKVKFESIIQQRTKENELAQKSVQAKSDFLAKMSHEIRTPMNAVIGMINMLMETNLTDRQLYYSQTIKKSSGLLLTLVNDILDLSKLEAGKMKLKETEVNLLLMLENLMFTFDSQAKRNGNELSFWLDDNVPALLITDEVRLTQVFNNLISNALKYTESGSVNLKITYKQKIKDEVLIKVEVMDTGIGISDIDKQKLFKEFSQVESVELKKVPGTGLGLSISAKIVNLIGGEIGVESEKGRGSNFWFTFKAGVSEKQKTISAIKSCLIVKYGTALNNEIIASFNRWNLPLEVISNEIALISELELGKKFDFVLIHDDQFKEDHQLLTLKKNNFELIFLTKSENKAKAENAGFTRIINTDPYNSINLLMPLMGEKEIATPSYNELSIKKEMYSRHIQILVVEDNVINQELISLMLEKIGCSVQFANNGKEAINRVKNNEYDLIFMDIHMPVMDGITATQEIKSLNKENLPPIIALTAHAMEGDLEKFIEQGMDDYLPKPIEGNELRSIIKKWLNIRSKSVEKNNEHSLPSKVIANQNGKQKLLNPKIVENIQKLGAGDGSAFIKIINSFFMDWSEIEKNIQNGFDEKDYDKVRFGAHTLKGSSSFIGATGITNTAKEIEYNINLSNNGEALKKFGDLKNQIRDLKKYAKDEYAIDYNF